MNQIDPNHKLNVLGWLSHGLGLLLVAACVLLAEVIVYGPIDEHTAACIRQTAELQKVLRDEDTVRAEHARLTKELTAALQRAATLQARLPDEPREVDFLAQAAGAAGDVGLQIRDYRPGTATSRQSYSVMQVELICTGDYASICNFLHRLSKLPRHTTVADLQVDATEGRPQYSATISVTLYFAATGCQDANSKGTDHA